MFGYLDVLCAAFVTTAAFGLSFGRSHAVVALSGCCLLAAVMTKSEGLLFVVVVLGVQLLSRPKAWKLVAGLAALAIIPALVWRSIVTGINASPSGDVSPGGLIDLLLLRSDRISRVGEATRAVLRHSLVLLPATVVVGLMRRLSGSMADIEDERRGALALLLSAWGALIALIAVYVGGTSDLNWWLDASVDRVTATPVLIGLCVIAECVLVVQPEREPAYLGAAS